MNNVKKLQYIYSILIHFYHTLTNYYKTHVLKSKTMDLDIYIYKPTRIVSKNSSLFIIFESSFTSHRIRII